MFCYRRRCDIGIGSPDSLWVIVYNFIYRGCSRGDGPFERVALGNYAVAVLVDHDLIAVPFVIIDDDVVGWGPFGCFFL